MCRKIRNDNVYYNRHTGERVVITNTPLPFNGGLWALRDWEYVIDSRGEPIGYMESGVFIPHGE